MPSSRRTGVIKRLHRSGFRRAKGADAEDIGFPGMAALVHMGWEHRIRRKDLCIIGGLRTNHQPGMLLESVQGWF
ncbi:MAG: hypothetical protein GDA36_12895 [Rhodobacteraceae bacterium]|nr:hypothetical protein [Paracoccaceae bacterium]